VTSYGVLRVGIRLGKVMLIIVSTIATSNLFCNFEVYFISIFSITKYNIVTSALISQFIGTVLQTLFRIFDNSIYIRKIAALNETYFCCMYLSVDEKEKTG
jgi:hypothetical protein